MSPYSMLLRTRPRGVILTHFNPVLHLYIPWKRQKTFGVLTFSGGIEMEQKAKMD